ncbi:hypothetical protein SLEP1_g11200 [Rubroshorea leprosula]|uniref:Bromo domain-containing protein n=1 Tax=Rubroshorea leprosula TaxID=152421 RepID=A0AAV5IKE3_9ROSI|nr:hypothetical protein SLEP1_g11200 [Rubroshorea leprosula]
MGGNVGAETMTKKKKKKGRPSLLELQKRSLKQQQQQQQESANLTNPSSLNSNRRSTRRNPNSDGSSPGGEGINTGGDDDDERQQKKHKLLHGLNSRGIQQHYPINSSVLNSNAYGSDSNLDGEDPEASALKRRKIGAVASGSNQTGEKALKATDTLHGSLVESGPTTPLPDKKLLVFILDRLQKKDTYGVFSEPVDPEELPDYHDIIANPMDFGTVRKKLDGGAYMSLEEFEKDVFLICSNAMEYNAPDTIYFRQARSMHELAKKDFENLRQDSDDSEPQPKVVRRGRPPGKSIKKSLEPSSLERVASEFSSDATLAAGGDAPNWQNNLRRGTNSYRLRPAETLVRPSYASHNHETYSNWSSEWENEFPASVVRAVMKYGMKHFPVDENKRDTYNNSLNSGDEQFLFGTLDGRFKQLIPVGLYEHGYATSLARFAANLGPAVWKIASKKIERVLPNGVQFGPGWVGENRDNEQQQLIISEKEKSSNNSQSDNHSTRHFSPAASGSNSVLVSRFSSQGGEDAETARVLNSQSESSSQYNRVSETKPVSPHNFQQRPHQSDMNGFCGGYGVNYSSQMGVATPTGNSRSNNPTVPSQMYGMVSDGIPAISPRPAADSGRLQSSNTMAPSSDSASHAAAEVGLQGKPSWQGLSPYNKQDLHPFPPDLNVRFLAPGSPSSSLRIGSPQQPDLALQL